MMMSENQARWYCLEPFSHRLETNHKEYNLQLLGTHFNLQLIDFLNSSGQTTDIYNL